MESPVDKSERSRRQGFDALMGEKDSVAGGFGELLDAGCHVDGVTDQGELQLALPMVPAMGFRTRLCAGRPWFRISYSMSATPDGSGSPCMAVDWVKTATWGRCKIMANYRIITFECPLVVLRIFSPPHISIR